MHYAPSSSSSSSMKLAASSGATIHFRFQRDETCEGIRDRRRRPVCSEAGWPFHCNRHVLDEAFPRLA